MKRTIKALVGVGLVSVVMLGCTNAQVGGTTGAVAGAGIGYAVTGSPLGTVIGAGAGGLIGTSIGQQYDRPVYYPGYYYY